MVYIEALNHGRQRPLRFQACQLSLFKKALRFYSRCPRTAGLAEISLRWTFQTKIVVDETFRQVKPDVVVHAATLTDVDKCELNKELAWKINVEGTKNIIEAAKAADVFLIYISTDYVFSGEKGNYKETDTAQPN